MCSYYENVLFTISHKMLLNTACAIYIIYTKELDEWMIHNRNTFLSSYNIVGKNVIILCLMKIFLYFYIIDINI